MTAPSTNGHIAHLLYQPAPSEDKEPYGYVRIPRDTVTLIAGHGIEGDRKAGKNPKRNLNIMASETVKALAAEGFKTQPGEMGEQIQLSGIDVNALKRGDRLQIGSAIVEITMPRTGCAWFEKIQTHSPKTVQGRLGQMASVIEGGEIRVGDPVRVLEQVAIE
jgi:MOSC domain-containing protein YiiM